MDKPKYSAAELNELIQGLRVTIAKQGELIAELRREPDELRAPAVSPHYPPGTRPIGAPWPVDITPFLAGKLR